MSAKSPTRRTTKIPLDPTGFDNNKENLKSIIFPSPKPTASTISRSKPRPGVRTEESTPREQVIKPEERTSRLTDHAHVEPPTAAAEGRTEGSKIQRITEDPWSLYTRILTVKADRTRWHAASDGVVTLSISAYSDTSIEKRFIHTNHTTIMQILDVFEWKKRFFVVTQETPKSTLQMALTVIGGTLPSADAVYILRHMLEAILYLKRHGIEFMPTNEDIFLERDTILIGGLPQASFDLR